MDKINAFLFLLLFVGLFYVISDLKTHIFSNTERINIIEFGLNNLEQQLDYERKKDILTNEIIKAQKERKPTKKGILKLKEGKTWRRKIVFYL